MLRGIVHIVYGIPFHWATSDTGCKVMLISVSFALFHWCAFGYEMHIVKTYWSADSSGPKEPVETLVLTISLVFSGAISYTLAVAYFYNPQNKFNGSSTVLVPKVLFTPNGQQEDIGPSEKDWLYTYTFFTAGTLSVIFVCYCAFGLDVFLNFYGLHKFTANITLTHKVIYYGNVTLIYWGFEGVVIICCVFYILCRDIIRHIEFVEELILSDAKTFFTARKYYECLLHYTENLISSLKLWFTVHTVFFMFIVLSLFVEWIASVQSNDNFKVIWLSQTAGSCLIAFKYAFPFLAASRVSARYDKMFETLNTQLNHRQFPEAGEFLSYCKRCAAGFKLFGLRITANVAIISFMSCFVGFFKFYKQIFKS